MTKIDFDFKDYKLYIQRKGLDRKKTGAMKNEADFIAGAMCAMFFLEQKQEIPAAWVFGPLGNKEIFTKEMLESFEASYYSNERDEDEEKEK